MGSDVDDDSYFERRGATRFLAADTSGAWAEKEQHIAPMTGLLVHEIERAVGDDGKVLARLSLDILGVVRSWMLYRDPIEAVGMRAGDASYHFTTAEDVELAIDSAA